MSLNSESVDFFCNKVKTIRQEIHKQIIGQDLLIDGLIMGMVEGGHVLVEGVPGLAKTLAIKTLAETIDVEYKRIQFTPDLLPADLTGHIIYRQQTQEFTPRKGPVFTQILLADEINRAPAKVQSALLEAMEERQVTLGDSTHLLPKPFFVMATQNPIEEEGTYRLPEAQLDRFTLKILVQYPSPQEEFDMLINSYRKKEEVVSKSLTVKTIQTMQLCVDKVELDERIARYIINLVNASREKESLGLGFSRFIDFGISPRGSLALYRCASINALFEGRSHILPEDVKAVAHAVFRHRIVLSYEAESQGLGADDIITDILNKVSIP